MGCTDPSRRSFESTAISVNGLFGWVASYLIYADVRLDIPMTHRNGRCPP